MIEGLCVIARADQGGLAAQTAAYVKHLRPEFVVLMDLQGAGRGQFDPNRLDLDDVGSVRVVRGTQMGLHDIVWMLKRAETVFSAETFYHPEMCDAANAAGARLVLHVNPELHTPDRNGALLLNPSPYMLDRFPAHLQMPVDMALASAARPSRGEGPLVFMHPAAPASNDRNGTNIVLEAIQHIKSPVEIRIIGSRPRNFPTKKGMAAKVTWVPGVTEWWEAYEGVDVLVLPRRYAGLSLSCQEAASFGIPAITLNVPPFSNGYCSTSRIRTVGSRSIRMAGGPIPVHEADGIDLARAIDTMYDSPAMWRRVAAAAEEWAMANSWEKLLPEYRKVLR